MTIGEQIGGSCVFTSTFRRTAVATLGEACHRVSSPPAADSTARYDTSAMRPPFWDARPTAGVRVASQVFRRERAPWVALRRVLAGAGW